MFVDCNASIAHSMSFGFFPSYYRKHTTTGKGTNSNFSERHYLCVECDVEFALPISLSKHVYAVHTTQRMKSAVTPVKSPASKQENKCPLCSLSIGRTSFKRHMITEHDTDPYLCTICNSRFNAYEQLIQHRTECRLKKAVIPSRETKQIIRQKKTKFNCQLCSHVLLGNESSLFSHMYSHHNPYSKTFSCSFCSSAFSRISHLGSHSKVHKHLLVCDTCGLQCFFLEELREHASRCPPEGNQISENSGAHPQSTADSEA